MTNPNNLFLNLWGTPNIVNPNIIFQNGHYRIKYTQNQDMSKFRTYFIF